MPAETQHPLPGDGSPGGPGHPAPSAAVPVPGAPAQRGSLTSAPFTPDPCTPAPFTPASRTDTPVTAGADAPDLDEIVDWETGAPPREDDPYRSYCEEGEPRDGDEWPEESYLLAAPGDPGPERFAAGGTADAMAPGPVLAILADRIERAGLEELDDDQLTGVLQAAGRLTTGQLRALVRRAVLAADPAAARRRKEQALKDARVETFTEHAGTAALSGRDLAPADVLAADKHLTALAQAMKAAGITGTLDVLRASAYLHLLSGQPASTLIPTATIPDGTASGTGTGPHFPPAPAAPGSAGPGGYPPGSTHPPGASPGLRGTVNLTIFNRSS